MKLYPAVFLAKHTYSYKPHGEERFIAKRLFIDEELDGLLSCEVEYANGAVDFIPVVEEYYELTGQTTLTSLGSPAQTTSLN